MLQDAGLEAKTAGPTHGSDLTVTGPKGTLNIEVKPPFLPTLVSLGLNMILTKKPGSHERQLDM